MPPKPSTVKAIKTQKLNIQKSQASLSLRQGKSQGGKAMAALRK